MNVMPLTDNYSVTAQISADDITASQRLVSNRSFAIALTKKALTNPILPQSMQLHRPPV
jgi:hypothetical protein